MPLVGTLVVVVADELAQPGQRARVRRERVEDRAGERVDGNLGGGHRRPVRAPAGHSLTPPVVESLLATRTQLPLLETIDKRDQLLMERPRVGKRIDQLAVARPPSPHSARTILRDLPLDELRQDVCDRPALGRPAELVPDRVRHRDPGHVIPDRLTRTSATTTSHASMSRQTPMTTPRVAHTSGPRATLFATAPSGSVKRTPTTQSNGTHLHPRESAYT